MNLAVYSHPPHMGYSYHRLPVAWGPVCLCVCVCPCVCGALVACLYECSAAGRPIRFRFMPIHHNANKTFDLVYNNVTLTTRLHAAECGSLYGLSFTDVSF